MHNSSSLKVFTHIKKIVEYKNYFDKNCSKIHIKHYMSEYNKVKKMNSIILSQLLALDQSLSFFSRMNSLTKLRIAVGLIVGLASLAIILVFTVNFFSAALSIILSYLIAIVLLIKLFTIEKL